MTTNFQFWHHEHDTDFQNFLAHQIALVALLALHLHTIVLVILDLKVVLSEKLRPDL